MAEAKVDIGMPKDESFESFTEWINGLREQLGMKSELEEEDIETLWVGFWKKEGEQGL